MIFVCVGSREYQFDRLIKKIDELVEAGDIKEKVFAQIGQSTYLPKKISYKRYMSSDEFECYQKNANLIISHGGTGALIGALKLNQQVIAVPRLAKFKEHTDDHQKQVSEVLDKEGYLLCVTNIDDLFKSILELKNQPIIKRYNKPSKVKSIIDNFIAVNQ